MNYYSTEHVRDSHYHVSREVSLANAERSAREYYGDNFISVSEISKEDALAMFNANRADQGLPLLSSLGQADSDR